MPLSELADRLDAACAAASLSPHQAARLGVAVGTGLRHFGFPERMPGAVVAMEMSTGEWSVRLKAQDAASVDVRKYREAR